MSREVDIEALGAHARAVEEQLQAIRARVSHLKRAPRRAAAVATVDPERCAGCAICEEVCPVGAISVTQVARVDGARCTGCGRCVAECPRGAATLREG